MPRPVIGSIKAGFILKYQDMSGDEELFIETMRWSGGRFHLAELHRNRMERTRKGGLGRVCTAIRALVSVIPN